MLASNCAACLHASLHALQLTDTGAHHLSAPCCTCLVSSSCHCCSRLAGITIRVVLMGTASSLLSSVLLCFSKLCTGQEAGGGLDRMSIRLCRVFPKPCGQELHMSTQIDTPDGQSYDQQGSTHRSTHRYNSHRQQGDKFICSEAMRCHHCPPNHLCV